MNIFAVNQNPIQAAKELSNKHVIKMISESLTMLSFAFPEGTAAIKNSRSNPHHRHPASIWARQSRENFDWLLTHALALCDEYTLRYKREHIYQEPLLDYCSKADTLYFPTVSLTPFACCFGDFKGKIDMQNPVAAYQEFYRLDKADFARWPSIEKIPAWWHIKTEDFVDKSFKNGQYIKR